MDSSSSTSSSFIIPDSPPAEHPHLNYWQHKAATSAAASADAASAPLPLTAEPLSPGEVMLSDSPVQRLGAPPTWAPRRAALTTLSNNVQQKQQGKRKLAFDEEEASGDEEQSVFMQAKKRAVEHNSSLVPLMMVVRRAEAEDEEELDFVQLINRPTPKPWVPLRDLQEGVPHPILAAREVTNKHGRCVILKIICDAQSKSQCEVYLPQQFSSCITADKIDKFNLTCKNLSLVVTHKSANWSDIKIVKH